MSISPQPDTQQVPMPRATTAAWEVMPPRTVRMPCAARHALDVLGRGLQADQNDLLALLGPLLGVLGGEDDLAAGSAGRGGQALADRGRPSSARRRRTAGAAGYPGCLGSIMQDGLFFVDHALVHQVAGDLQRGGGGALAVAGLEHVELAVLDGELHVLHVAVVVLQRVADAPRTARRPRA